MSRRCEAAVFHCVIFAAALLLLSAIPARAKQERPISTPRLIELAKMAARHDGGDLADPESSFVELDEESAADPIPGYVTVEWLRHRVAVEMVYTVRMATGDVVNASTCTLYRYPDLMKFRKERMKETGSPPVGPKQIDDELGCMGTKIAPASVRGKKNR